MGISVLPEQDFESLVLGESSEAIAIRTVEENRLAALSMARQARRTLDVFSLVLEPAVYDQPEFAEAVKRIALGSAQARVRLLVRDVGTIVRRGHRLLALARRLSSFIELRVQAAEHHRFNSAVLIADRTGTIVRELADEPSGTAIFSNRRAASELSDTFTEMWEASDTDPNLRRLHI